MSRKTNIGLLAFVVTLGVAVMTALGLAGFQADQEIAHLPVVQLTSTRTAAGQVAGVAVETATVSINRGAGTTITTKVSISDNGTVLDALTEAAKVYSLKLDVNTSSSMGAYVNGIGDTTGGQDNKYWIGYINGKSLNVAVDRQTVKPGDKIEFKFEKSIF